jgi:hypothetical protein
MLQCLVSALKFHMSHLSYKETNISWNKHRELAKSDSILNKIILCMLRKICGFMRYEIYGVWQTLYTKEFRNLNSSPNTVKVLKSRIQVKVFWVVKLCSVVIGYQHFRCLCHLHLFPQDGGSMDLWNVGVLPQLYITSQPRRPQSESSRLWKTKNLIRSRMLICTKRSSDGRNKMYV